MFYKYFGLCEQPFGVTPDPRFLFSSEPHREALASLIYGIECELGFSSLIGEPGLGKTTLLHALLERYSPTSRTAFVFSGEWQNLELIRHILDDFEVQLPGNDVDAMFRCFRDMLVGEAQAGKRVILFLDEAQALSPSALEMIRLLSNFEAPDSKLLHIVLAGQSQLTETLNHPSLVSLHQRITTPVRLRPLLPAETAQYIQHRLELAGARSAPLFAPEAIATVSEHSRGVPRLINRICLNAMTLACALERKQVSEKIVLDVLKDLEPELGVQPTKPGPVLVPVADTLPSPEPSTPAPVTWAQTTVTWGSQALAMAPELETKLLEKSSPDVEPQPLPVPVEIPDRVAELRSEVRMEPSPARHLEQSSHRMLLITASIVALVMGVGAFSFFARGAANTKSQQIVAPVPETSLLAPAKPPAVERRTPTARSLPASKLNHASAEVQPTRKETAVSTLHSGGTLLPSRGMGPSPRLKSVTSSAELEKSPADASSGLGNETNPSMKSSSMSIRGAAATPSAIPQITPPVLKLRVDPVFPPAARQQHLHGNIKMRLHLDKTGRVAGIMVLSGDSRLAAPAQVAVRQWVFSPFQQNGEPVEGNTTLDLYFTSGD